MNLFLSTAVAVALATPVPAETAAPDALSTLRGTYESTGAEPWYGGFGHREFVFADGNWSLTFTHALDPDMTLRTFQFRTGGSYAVGAPRMPSKGRFARCSGKTGST